MPYYFYFNLLAVTFFVVVFAISNANEQENDFLLSCKFPSTTESIKTKRNNSVEIFWINLDRSISRRQGLSKHLDELLLKNSRQRGFTLDDIYIPTDVKDNWYKKPVLSSTYPLPNRLKTNYSIVISGLSGRKKNNKLMELGCTVSHLMTMYRVIFQSNSTSKYAVIMEDDVFIPFDIDFESMARSAPDDFGILQLFNSNEETMENLWNQYRKAGRLWVPRWPKAAGSFWSTCAYLINKDKLRPIISQLIKFHTIENEKWIDIKIIAATKENFCDHVFVPKECCKTVFNVTLNTTVTLDQPDVLCSFAPRGFQADTFLYALTKVYVLTVPLITNGVGGNESTFHQNHVIEFHKNAFIRQRNYMNTMLTKQLVAPFFARPLCSQPIPTVMILSTNQTILVSDK